MAQAFCIKCKKKVEISSPERGAFENGTPVEKGTCPVCGGKVFRIMKKTEISQT